MRPLALCFAAALCVGSASAQTTGATSLEAAKDAWNRGEFQQAETLLVEALARGGLKRDQTLECYVRLGSARAVLGRKQEATAAFRQAALLDADFAVPADAGKRASQAAEAVKKQQAGFGVLALALDLPRAAAAGSPVPVTVKMDPAHTPLVARVALSAREATTGKTFALESAPSTTMRFTVPASLALPGGDVAVRAEALDKSDNRLAVSEGRVRVGAEAARREEPASAAKGGGFWGSAWPWVIGGALLTGAAAGGLGAYFAFQGAGTINVGAPALRTGG